MDKPNQNTKYLTKEEAIRQVKEALGIGPEAEKKAGKVDLRAMIKARTTTK